MMVKAHLEHAAAAEGGVDVRRDACSEAFPDERTESSFPDLGTAGTPVSEPGRSCVRLAAAALALLLICPPTFAQSQDPPTFALSQWCDQLNDDLRNEVVELFEYSQRVERSEDRRENELTACVVGNQEILPTLDISPVAVSPKLVNEIQGHLEKRDDLNAFDTPAFVNTVENSNSLHVGCQVYGIDPADVRSFYAAVEMGFYSWDSGQTSTLPDLIELNLAVSQAEQEGAESERSGSRWRRVDEGFLNEALAAASEEGEDNEALAAASEEGEDGARWVVLPGTDWRFLEIINSNRHGEICAFPAAKAVVELICKARDGTNSGNGQLKLVGHSLGGAVAQFIATSPHDCSGVEAFAFGSIGLKSPNSEFQWTVSDGSSLKSYASDCDSAAQWFFSSRVQPSSPDSLFTLSPLETHFIDSIQHDLCRCLNSDQELTIRRHNSQPPLTNSALCNP